MFEPLCEISRTKAWKKCQKDFLAVAWTRSCDWQDNAYSFSFQYFIGPRVKSL